MVSQKHYCKKKSSKVSEKCDKSFSKLCCLIRDLSQAYKDKLKCFSCGKNLIGNDYCQNFITNCNSGEKTVGISIILNYLENFFNGDGNDEDFVPSMMNIGNPIADEQNIKRIEENYSLNIRDLERYWKQAQFWLQHQRIKV